MLPLLLTLALLQLAPRDPTGASTGIHLPIAGESATASVDDASPTPRAQAPSNPAVRIPRIQDAEVTLDGVLDEAVWQQAAELRGFSQYLPVDNRPASDSTTVLVWYSPTDIYFGVRAYQDSATVRATLADRDRIGGDDHVQILLDTFNDQRQAIFFAVNPLGVQSDGTIQDGEESRANYISSQLTGAYQVDLNPDYLYESRGRVTADGYRVEMRIPFKTLRYQDAKVQDWGLNIIRQVQASGHRHTWTRVLQSNPSFLAQGGTLEGLTDLQRGLVLDVNPEATSSLTGQRASAGWDYSGGSPEIGMNVRWGITNNLTLNGTANPDFSQVEADVAQIAHDPRETLHYPEKRPFFLDGLEMFQTPVLLIYTRRLTDPVGAAKVTGKVSDTNVAILSGVDHKDQSLTGSENPVYNLARIRRDIGEQNTLGITYTDLVDGDHYNRVGAVDGRFVLGGKYSLTFMGGGSATGDAEKTRWSPFWLVAMNREGERYGFSFRTRGFGEDFRAESGLVSRIRDVYVGLSPSIKIFGSPESRVERWTGNILLDGFWDYDRFWAGHIPDDPRLHFNLGVTFRGGWQLGTSLLLESFSYPEQLYREYAVERTVGSVTDTIPFTGTDRLYNLDFGANFATPQYQKFSANGFLIVGRDQNFYEWASAHIAIGTLSLNWRPTEQARVSLLYNHQQYIRPDDGSTVAIRRIPRLKVEYQLTRSIFFRFVGQYDANKRDDLRDNSRTEGPLLYCAEGVAVCYPLSGTTWSDFQVDWLFSYRPSPGTVVYAGYGSSLLEHDTFRFKDMERTRDGFFIKLSYLFRM